MTVRADQIAAINARIASLYVGGDARSASSSHRTSTATRCAEPVLSVSPAITNSEGEGEGEGDGDGDKYGIGGNFDEAASEASLSSTTTGGTAVAISTTSTNANINASARKIKSSTRALCPSDVAEDLDVDFRDHKRRHRFPPYGITVKATSTSTYLNVQFIDCNFDSYAGTLLDDCVLDNVIFDKCNFRGSTIVKLVAKGTRFTGCTFAATHFEGISLIEDAVILNQSFVFNRVIRGSASDNSHSAHGSAIQEFEVVKRGMSQIPRQYGWAKEEDNKAVQGAGQLVEAPAYAGWEGNVVKPAPSGDLMSFDEATCIDFENAEAQAKSSALVPSNGSMLSDVPHWDRQFIREGVNAVKLVNHEIEAPADAKTFAPTNFVKLDFNADPETRKEEVSDDFTTGTREYYGTRKDKSKRFWSEKKVEQQERGRRNKAGAPHYSQDRAI